MPAISVRSSALALMLAAVAGSPTCAAQQAGGYDVSELATVDPAIVLRFDPIENRFFPVPTDEQQPGYIYNRYSPVMGRRVWSKVREGGGFEYAMATGAVQPARLLDLRTPAERLRAEVENKAPELLKVIDRGGVASMRLQDDGAWELVPLMTIASLYDLETSRRWEWHGDRRVAVVHTGGYLWSLVDGQYAPAYAMTNMAAACW